MISYEIVWARTTMEMNELYDIQAQLFVQTSCKIQNSNKRRIGGGNFTADQEI